MPPRRTWRRGSSALVHRSSSRPSPLTPTARSISSTRGSTSSNRPAHSSAAEYCSNSWGRRRFVSSGNASSQPKSVITSPRFHIFLATCSTRSAARSFSWAASACRIASDVQPFRSYHAAALRCSSLIRSGCSRCKRERRTSAKRGAHALRHRRLEQEFSHPFGLPFEDLLSQEVQDVAVAPGEGLDEAGEVLAVAHREGRKLEGGDPTLRHPF